MKLCSCKLWSLQEHNLKTFEARCIIAWRLLRLCDMIERPYIVQYTIYILTLLSECIYAISASSDGCIIWITHTAHCLSIHCTYFWASAVCALCFLRLWDKATSDNPPQPRHTALFILSAPPQCCWRCWWGGSSSWRKEFKIFPQNQTNQDWFDQNLSLDGN